MSIRLTHGRFSSNEAAHCPAIIATTNSATLGEPDASAASAGPGQKPATPQPTPKIIAPAINEPSSLISSAGRKIEQGLGAPKNQRKRRHGQ
jgi:hypothetical protein